MPKLAMMTLFFSFSSFDADAQGLLKGIANKAKAKVEQKVEGSVGKAAGKAIAGKSNAVKSESKANVKSDNGIRLKEKYGENDGYFVTTHGAFDNEKDPFLVYVEDLAAPDAPQDWHYADIDSDIVSDDVTFHSIQESIDAFPPLATTQQMLTLDEAPLKAIVNYYKGVNKLAVVFTENMIAATDKAKSKAAGKKGPSAAQRAQMDNNAAQVFAYMQKHNIDPEKMSDKEMEELMKKAVMSGEIKLSGMGGAFAIDPEYSEEQDEAINEVSKKVDAVNEKINEAAETEAIYTADAFNLEKKLKPLYAELQAAWLKSDACKQVQENERDIDKRASEYFEKHADYGNNGAVIKYPDFWVQGRKQQNEIIRSFNMEQVEKWRKVLQEIYDKHLPSVKELAAVDNELEATFPDKSDLIYNTLKQRLNNAFVLWNRMYQILLDRSYGAPLVCGVAEEDFFEQ